MIPLLLMLCLGSAPSPRGPVSEAFVQRLANGLRGKVGEWVSYRLHGGLGGVAYWRMAIVGKQKDDLGRDAMWLEMEADRTSKFVAPLLQVRLLVAEGRFLEKNAISRMILAVGTGKPREVDVTTLGLDDPAQAPAAAPAKQGDAHAIHVRRGQMTHLMTPAGMVKARPLELIYRSTIVQQFWVSPEVPILGLAKIDFPKLGDQYALEVQDYGIDAKPRIRMPDPSLPKVTLDPPIPTSPPPGGSHAPAPAPNAP